MNPTSPALPPTPLEAPLPVLRPDELPRVEHLVTEDDTPVDNIPSEKQQRLLADPLYNSWAGPGEGRPFLAMTNVGLFYSVQLPPVVPDFMLSLGVRVADNWWAKRHRSYFVWEFGKLPEVVVEIVSNLEGGEADSKFRIYEQQGVRYYVIYDPAELLSKQVLRVFGLHHPLRYEQIAPDWLPAVGLGLTLWHGTFEDKEAAWLRWCDRDGNVLPTGRERAEQEQQRAEQERQRAELERQRADQESQRAKQESQRADQESQRAELERHRAERLAEQLRALGIDPSL